MLTSNVWCLLQIVIEKYFLNDRKCCLVVKELAYVDIVFTLSVRHYLKVDGTVFPYTF